VPNYYPKPQPLEFQSLTNILGINWTFLTFYYYLSNEMGPGDFEIESDLESDPESDSEFVTLKILGI